MKENDQNGRSGMNGGGTEENKKSRFISSK